MCRPCANGMMLSASPCHQCTGTFTSSRRNPQSRPEQQDVGERRRELAASLPREVAEEHRLEVLVGEQGAVAGGREAGVQADDRIAERGHRLHDAAQAEAHRHPPDTQQRLGEPGEIDDATTGRIRPDRGCDAAERTDRGDALGEARSRGERVGTTSREADDRTLGDSQGIEHRSQVVREGRDVAVHVGGGSSDARSVDADDPQAIASSPEASLLGHLRARSRGPVHPHHRTPVMTTELRERELAPRRDLDDPLDPCARDGSHPDIVAGRAQKGTERRTILRTTRAELPG